MPLTVRGAVVFSLLAALPVTAAGCHEPEPQLGPACTPGEATLQMGVNKMRLCVGESARATASWSNGCVTRDVTADVQWTTSSSKVLRSEGGGRITAVSPGSSSVVAVLEGQTSGARIIVAHCD